MPTYVWMRPYAVLISLGKVRNALRTDFFKVKKALLHIRALNSILTFVKHFIKSPLQLLFSA